MIKRLVRRAIAGFFLAACLFGCSATAQKQQDLSERQKVAMAMFNERCKKAGEFIHRTVDDVEGIYLLKVRPKTINYGNQFELDDPYGHDLGGDGYVGSLLRGSYQANTKDGPVPGPLGYLYVEAVDPNDGVRYRYTGEIKEVTRTMSVMSGGDGKTTFRTKEYVVDRAKSDSPVPRYAVTYDDISTRQEREYWIAGSSLKVIDLQSKEVMAERVGYMVDVFQGSTAGGRSPWLLAADHACPGFQLNPQRPPIHSSTSQLRQTQRFVEKVLKPKN